MTIDLQILISLLPGLKIREQLFLCELFHSVEDLRDLTSRDISSIIKRHIKVKPYKISDFVPKTDRIRNFVDSQRDIRVIWFWDNDYPPQLREIFDPPAILYVRGGWFSNNTPHAGVVGTRHPTGKGARGAFTLGMEFAQGGVPVVSGLALGIDSAVHTGTVRGGGVAIAVLGNGIDSIYPSSNRRLAGEIMSNGGALVSEFPPGTKPLKYNFPKRNRIISGLSRGVVVVEAPLKSGALITADFALEQGRELYVHSSSLGSVRGDGSFRLSVEGAPIVECAMDVLSLWGESTSKFGTSLKILEQPEEWSLSDLMEAELSGRLFQYNGNYFLKEVGVAQ